MRQSRSKWTSAEFHEAKAIDTKKLRFMSVGEIGTRSRASNKIMILLSYHVVQGKSLCTLVKLYGDF
jgi:hypothetical protein